MNCPWGWECDDSAKQLGTWQGQEQLIENGNKKSSSGFPPTTILGKPIESSVPQFCHLQIE